MKYFISILANFLALRLLAVPAYPGRIYVVVDNGKSVAITMKGDEYFKYALSEDGYTLLNVGNEWKYATTDINGNMVASEFSLTAIEDENADLRIFKEKCPKHLCTNIKADGPYSQRRVQRIGVHNGEPITGQRRALVVLMQYRDVKFSKSKDNFESLFNEEGFSLDNAKGSVKDYYSFASSGQLDYISDIYGPYTASNNMRYYGQNSSRGGGDVNAIELCLEAIRNLPKDLDYSKYDNDHDGIVDNIHIIFAGYGEESGASGDAIWSHEYPYKIIMKNEIGVNFAGYSCTPELRGNFGKKISNIGVICHELGHALGANDYYDTNYALEGSYDGTGKWDIMASGSWNDDGRLPPNFNPYVRTHDFGWEEQQDLVEEGTITLPPHSYNLEDNIVIRLNTESSNDYFLLENRQQIQFDASLPGNGLLIYHIHPDIDYLSESNSINNTNPQGFYPVCASGSKPSSNLYGNINTGECPFPGSHHITSFMPFTSPSAKAWDGSYTKFSLTNIKELSDGSITFSVGKHEEIIEDPDIDDNSDLTTIFYDSFENGISGYRSSILMGKKDWTYYPSSVIVSNTEMIPTPSDGKKLLMLFTGKNQTICEAEIESKNIDIIPDRKYFLSFDVTSSFLPESMAPVFKFWVTDDNVQLYSQTIQNLKDTWEHIEVPIVSSMKSIRFGFYGNVYTGGLFVDNLKLQTIEDASSIMQLSPKDVINIGVEGKNIVSFSSTEDHNVEIYSTNGLIIRQLHLNANELSKIFLPSGMYIIRWPGHFHKIGIQ